MAKKRRSSSRRPATGKQVKIVGTASARSSLESFFCLDPEQSGQKDAADIGTVSANGTGGLRFAHQGGGQVRCDAAGYHFEDGAELVAVFDPREVTYAVVDFEFTPAPNSGYAYPLILSMRSENRMQISFNDRLCAVNGPAGSRLTQPMDLSSEDVMPRRRLQAAFDLCGDWIAGGSVMALFPENPSDTQVSSANDSETTAPAMLSEIILGRGGDIVLHRAKAYLFSDRPSFSPKEFLNIIGDGKL